MIPMVQKKACSGKKPLGLAERVARVCLTGLLGAVATVGPFVHEKNYQEQHLRLAEQRLATAEKAHPDIALLLNTQATHVEDGTYLSPGSASTRKELIGLLKAHASHKPLYERVMLGSERGERPFYRVLIKTNDAEIERLREHLTKESIAKGHRRPRTLRYAHGKGDWLAERPGYDAREAKNFHLMPYFSLFDQVGRERNLSLAFLYSNTVAESELNPRAVSHAGAKGLLQLMPATARENGVKNPYDPKQSIRGGADYIDTLLDRFDRADLAVAAFNAGPANVENGRYLSFPETRRHVRLVAELYDELSSLPRVTKEDAIRIKNKLLKRMA